MSLSTEHEAEVLPRLGDRSLLGGTILITDVVAGAGAQEKHSPYEVIIVKRGIYGLLVEERTSQNSVLLGERVHLIE